MRRSGGGGWLTRRSPWDTQHPGRTWAADQRLADAKSKAQSQAELLTHLAPHPPDQTLEEVVESLIEELRQV
jgi:hypothetical protein